MIGLLIITYPGIGSSLLTAAEHVLSVKAEKTKVIEISDSNSTDNISTIILNNINMLKNSTTGIIILVDLYGSTHANIACKYTVAGSIELVSGLSLPMLLKIINYRDLKLNELIDKIMKNDRDTIQYKYI